MYSNFEVIERNGKVYKVFDLPNTNCFFFKCESNVGSNLESILFKKINKNYYGICHLIEHLCFKDTLDFDTETLSFELRKYGSHNAGTSYDNLTYHYYTTSHYFKEAVNMVMNAALNDFSRLQEKDFLLERNVVENEADMYYNSPEARFGRATRSLTGNGHPEDTVIGIKETIENFTLEDVKYVRNIHLKSYKEEYIIEYDSNRLMIDDIITYIEKTHSRIMDTIDLSNVEKIDNANIFNYLPNNKINILELPTKQTMFYLIFPLHSIFNRTKDEKIISRSTTLFDVNMTADYILNFAKNTNLYKIVREDKGLTYKISCGVRKIGEEDYVILTLNFNPEKYDDVVEAIKESLKLTADNFDIDDYKKYLEKEKINNTLYSVRENNFDFLLNIYMRDKKTFNQIKGICKNVGISSIYDIMVEMHDEKIDEGYFNPKEIYSNFINMLETGEFTALKAIDEEK